MTRLVRILLLAALLAIAGCSSAPAPPAGPTRLVGLFRLTPGAVSGNTVTGSWFRMVQPGGTSGAGPYMPNANSPAPGGFATLLAPGSEGGLRTGGYQSEPKSGFAADGDSLAGAIMTPTKFFDVDFGVSTNATDPQTGRTVAAPTVTDTDGTLTADVSAWSASWNSQEFNQGAPKPRARQGAQIAGAVEVQQVWDWVAQQWLNLPKDDSSSGPAATGAYNPADHHYTLQWTSPIVGGPFNGFTGVWHLEGQFEAGSPAPAGSITTHN